MPTEEELNARAAELDKREAALTRRVVHAALVEALSEAKCKPDALQDAAALMSTGAEITLADDGLSIAKLKIGSEEHGPAAAARAFLKARPHFQATDDGKSKQTTTPPAAAPDALVRSSFTTTPATPAAPKSKPSAEAQAHMSAHDLCQQGWSEDPE